MKNILVPSDFSPCSAAAYSYASLLADKTGATITLLNVLDVPFSNQATTGNVDSETAGDTVYMMTLLKLTRNRMSKIRSGKYFKDHEVNELVLLGTVPETVSEVVRKKKIDLVVMGTHGSSGFHERFIGSNAEKVVRNADVPVLTVKSEVKNPKIDKILVATDFSKEAEILLPTISQIADTLNAKMILTKIVTVSDFESTHESELQIEAFRNKCRMYNFTTKIYYSYSREEGIRRAADSMGASMIAMGTHGRHGLAHLFKGSIAEEVVNHAAIPVLTLNFHKRLTEKRKNNSKTKRSSRTEYDWTLQIPSI